MEEQIKLAPYTTFGIGGPAEHFARVTSEEELLDLASFAKQRNWPLSVLGAGSNLLVSDEGVKGLVIKNEITNLTYQEIEDAVFVTVGAGMVWDDLVTKAVAKNWWGIENLSGIPGTVGATPIQNVGAYGVEVDQLITEVRVLDTETLSFRNLNSVECGFSYRNSYFKTVLGRRLIVTSVTYKLSKLPQPQLSYKDLDLYFSGQADVDLPAIREAVIEIRANKFPNWKDNGTAGSFFKNPIISADEATKLHESYPELPVFEQTDGRVKVSLGYVLDKICKLRGYRDGNVGLYDKQALVLVNYGGATASEVTEFAQKVAAIVLTKTNLQLEWEVNQLK